MFLTNEEKKESAMIAAAFHAKIAAGKTRLEKLLLSIQEDIARGDTACMRTLQYWRDEVISRLRLSSPPCILKIPQCLAESCKLPSCRVWINHDFSVQVMVPQSEYEFTKGQELIPAL